MRASALLAALPLAAASPMTKRAPLIVAREDNVLQGKYIVKMKSGGLNTASSIQGAIDSIAGDADHVFSKLGGFAGSLTDEEVEALRNNPDVSGPSNHGLAHLIRH